MLFTSFTFLVFISFFFLSILLFKKYWKIICILFSALFYGYWNIKLLLLLYFVSFQAYYFGSKISLKNKKSNLYLLSSIFLSLFVLGFFKYSNFFINEFSLLFNIDKKFDFFTNIILPVGISFYTFQAMSYVIDIKRNKIESSNFIDVLIFICFFPQLVAGPIVRGSVFIPQIKRGINITRKNLKKGLIIVFWGYFLKLALADNLDIYVHANYENLVGSNTSSLIVSIIFYSFQIYGDFFGYSLIAIGIAKILGFHFPANFNLPYFSKSFQDFWRRWHISLSSFLRDYS